MRKQFSFSRIPLAAAVMLTLFSACKKEKIDLTDPVPTILGITVSPATVVEFQDSIIFLIDYRDGDGDLGENSPDAHNLFVTDNRINVTEEFRIRELAPQGAEIPITGTLRVVLRNTGITDNSNSQTVTYTIYMKDRAGNESDRLVTPSITVTR
ncbi:MAG: hypothetical protein IPN95_20865 [Bacteroidetes bacterium]|nr:hypothetical protein [Bacteroidota bacterium]